MPTRAEIRSQLPSHITDAQVRKAIASLGFVNSDCIVYTDAEAEQILGAFKSSVQGKQRRATTGKAVSALEAQQQAVATGAIAQSSGEMVSHAGRSLQSIDTQLSEFEDRYVEAVAERLEQVPARINAKLAARLGQVQTADPLAALTVAVDAWELPDISFECPAIAPSTVLGALPM
jgi:hypothetical protein